MNSVALYRIAGSLFLLAAILFFVTDKTAQGAAFIALGISFLAISTTHEKQQGKGE